MKSGEHDWQHIKFSLLQKRWETNPSPCSLPIMIQGLRKILIDKVSKDTEKVSKDKVKVSCAMVLCKYNQPMGGVNLFDQMKVSYQVDKKTTFFFTWEGLRIFFDFLDIIVVNSKIIYNKMILLLVCQQWTCVLALLIWWWENSQTGKELRQCTDLQKF